MVATKNYTAKDLMKTKLITLHPKDKMDRVKRIFEEYEFRHIPIVVANRVVGIISKSDYLRIEGIARDSFDAFLKDKMLNSHAVEKYMKHDVVCCDEETPLDMLLDLFIANAIHSVLVVEENSIKVIITPLDILKLMKKLL
jgi:acetoin utilization protein AcuB